MARQCKFPDKSCGIGARFTWWSKNIKGCRLSEWKQKIGVCPYDNTIRSRGRERLKRDKGQSRLEV